MLKLCKYMNLNIIIPNSWQELSDKQLLFVFRLLQGEYSLTQIKISQVEHYFSPCWA